MTAIIFCGFCSQPNCDCAEAKPVVARCYGCSPYTRGWVVGMRDGRAVHVACLDCNADRSKPLPVASN